MPRHTRNYPATVSEIIDDNIRYRRATISAAKWFARRKPWRGRIGCRKQKFARFHEKLCEAYGKTTRLIFEGTHRGGPSGSSTYTPAADVITLRGRLSVVTYLHEFAHALGRDERGACRWSVNLFKRCFPRSFSRCIPSGHCLMRPEARNTVSRTRRRRELQARAEHIDASTTYRERCNLTANLLEQVLRGM